MNLIKRLTVGLYAQQQNEQEKKKTNVFFKRKELFKTLGLIPFTDRANSKYCIKVTTFWYFVHLIYSWVQLWFFDNIAASLNWRVCMRLRVDQKTNKTAGYETPERIHVATVWILLHEIKCKEKLRIEQNKSLRRSTSHENRPICFTVIYAKSNSVSGKKYSTTTGRLKSQAQRRGSNFIHEKLKSLFKKQNTSQCEEIINQLFLYLNKERLQCYKFIMF